MNNPRQGLCYHVLFQEGLKQVRDSLSRTLNTTDIIQVWK